MKNDLAAKRCEACEGKVKPFKKAEIESYLKRVSGWAREGNAVVKSFAFQNFHQTMGFVNAVAWIANMENHHPDLEVSYKACRVKYTTHAIGGLSENDFICAAKIDKLLNA